MKSSELPLSKSQSWQMFNDISAAYDFLNHFLSFGLDISWRKKLIQFLPQKKSLKILDLATGTGDVLLILVESNSNIDKAVGIDLADKMLDIGRKKIDKKGLNNKIELKHGDANQIPFSNDQFDVITMSFGIRNVENPKIVLKEMHRTLRKEGRGLILEFSLPNNPIIRAGHIFYLRTIVPIFGWIFSGHYKAYKYLNQTIEQFPYGQQFCELMIQSGFKNVKANPLLLGVATIYQGDK